MTANAADPEAAFRDWVQRHDAGPATFATIAPDGTPNSAFGIAIDQAQPMPLASISKTVAGLCIVDLAQAGFLSLEDTLATHLGWTGPQGKVTLSQLLTHTSGFWPDDTQNDLIGLNLTRPARVEQILDGIPKRPIESPEHRYNNENYLLLGRVVAALADGDPLEFCKTNAPILKGLDSIGYAPNTFALGFAGGLEMSAPDLARFMARVTFLADWPRATIAENVFYGPGILIRDIQGGRNMWHQGGICTLTPSKNLGAFAVKMLNGWVVAAAFTGCQNGNPMAEFQREILGALPN